METYGKDEERELGLREEVKRGGEGKRREAERRG